MQQPNWETSTIIVHLACAYWPRLRAGCWAAVLVCGARHKELVGGDTGPSQHATTLRGLCRALDALRRPQSAVLVVTTNQYVVHGLEARFGSPGGGLTTTGNLIKNAELWRDVSLRAARFDLSAQWQPAASAAPELRRAMYLAKAADPAAFANSV